MGQCCIVKASGGFYARPVANDSGNTLTLRDEFTGFEYFHIFCGRKFAEEPSDGCSTAIRSAKRCAHHLGRVPLNVVGYHLQNGGNVTALKRLVGVLHYR